MKSLINFRVTIELLEAVKKAGINVSKVCREALANELLKLKKERK